MSDFKISLKNLQGVLGFLFLLAIANTSFAQLTNNSGIIPDLINNAPNPTDYTITTNVTFTGGAAGETYTLSGVISGGGSITMDGAGTLVVLGANRFTGSTTINTGATIRVGDGTNDIATLGTSDLNINGGSLEINSQNSTTLAFANIRVNSGGSIKALGGQVELTAVSGASFVAIGLSDNVTLDAQGSSTLYLKGIADWWYSVGVDIYGATLTSRGAVFIEGFGRGTQFDRRSVRILGDVEFIADAGTLTMSATQASYGESAHGMVNDGGLIATEGNVILNASSGLSSPFNAGSPWRFESRRGTLTLNAQVAMQVDATSLRYGFASSYLGLNANGGDIVVNASSIESEKYFTGIRANGLTIDTGTGTGDITINNDIWLENTGATISGAGNVKINGVIQNAVGDINNNGTGKVIVAATNGYSANTLVNSGSWGGSGTSLLSNHTVAAGASIFGGTGIGNAGTLAVKDLTMSAGSKLAVYGTASSASNVVCQAFSAPGNFIVDVLDNIGPGVYTVLAATGTVPTVAPAIGTKATSQDVCFSWIGTSLKMVVGPPLITFPPTIPTVCVGSSLPTITIKTRGATGIGPLTNLPTGINATAAFDIDTGDITITGTADATVADGTYTYQIPLTVACIASLTIGSQIKVIPLNTAGPAVGSTTACVTTGAISITHATTGATGVGAVTGLPTGVSASFANDQITVSGSPSVSSTFPYSIRLSGGCGNVNATGTITVNPTLALGPIPTNINQTVCVGSSIAQIDFNPIGATNLDRGNIIPPPSRIFVEQIARGVEPFMRGIKLYGTPDVAGVYNYSIPLVGPCSDAANPVIATGTITVTPPLGLGTAPSNQDQTLCINTPLADIIRTTTGASGIAAANLPNGVSANWTGTAQAGEIKISGRPNAAGTFPYTIRLIADACGGSLNMTGTIIVTPDLALGNEPGNKAQTVCVNTALVSIFRSALGATGIGTPRGFPNGVTPTWIRNPDVAETVNSQLIISGTPSEAGTFDYEVPFVGGCGTSPISATGTIIVTPAGVAPSAADTDFSVCINEAMTPFLLTPTNTRGIGANPTLPTGLSAAFVNNQIAITGTPSAAGTTTYLIPLDGCGPPVSATGKITVNPTLALGPLSANRNQTICIGAALTPIIQRTIGATGIGEPTDLPEGVTALWAGNQLTISGTPTEARTYSYSIPLVGICGPPVFATGTIVVNSTNSAGAPSATPTLCINTPLAAITIPTSGVSAIGRATNLPGGIVPSFVSGIITLQGTPTTPGTFDYSIVITGCGAPSTATGTITVTGLNRVQPPSSNPTVCINTPLTDITIANSGANGIGTPTDFPPGLQAAWADNVITITGSPSVAGTFNYSIPLTGGCAPTVNATGTIVVTPAKTVSAVIATPTLCISSDLAPVVTHTTTDATGIGSATGLPAGVTARWQNNVITLSGTPLQAGPFTYSIPILGCGAALNARGTITVTPANTVSTAATTTVCIDTALTPILRATSGATGIGEAIDLPPGVNADWIGDLITISGTPILDGTFNYTIPLVGGCGAVNARGTIIVEPHLSVATPSSNPTVCIDTPMAEVTIATTGANGIQTPIGMPNGVTARWANNIITIGGTPTVANTFTYTIPVTGCGPTTNIRGTITVTASNTVGAASSTPTLCANTALTPITHATSGATGIGTATNLPAGIGANWLNNVITISGTPTENGTFSYSIPLAGGCGTPLTATGTITVTTENAMGAASESPTLCVNTPLTPITHATAGGTGIGTPRGLPTGVTANWAADVITISGTPTQPGTFDYSIPLTGGCAFLNAIGQIKVDSPPPTPIITQVFNEPFATLTSSAPTGNQWFKDGVLEVDSTKRTYGIMTVDKFGQTIVDLARNRYTVKVTVGTCSTESAVESLGLITADKLLTDHRAMVVYPNPTTDQVTVLLEGFAGTKKVALYNLVGERLDAQEVSGNTATISLTTYPRGTYVVRVNTNAGEKSALIIKQ